VQNFLSACHGHRAGRGADPRLRPLVNARTVGNFWVDVTRTTLYVLLPMSVVLRAVLWSGRAFRRHSAPYVDATTLEGAKADHRGMVRSHRKSRSRCWAPMAAASSTSMPRIHSRTRQRLSNFVQMLSIFALGAALTNVFGRMVGIQSARAGPSWP
jgi:K+-transporting ATPase ATPase A chain